MRLFNKQQNGKKATEPRAEIVKDDVCGSHVSGRIKMESKNDWPIALGQHH